MGDRHAVNPVSESAPQEVKDRVGNPREPVFDPTLDVHRVTSLNVAWSGEDYADAVKRNRSSRFLAGDGRGGRGAGGLFSLDGVHPTTVGYGLIAQEIVGVMRTAGVEFRRRNSGARRDDPVVVDMERDLTGSSAC